MHGQANVKSASYNYDLRKALSAVSGNIAVSRSSAVRPSVRLCCVNVNIADVAWTACRTLRWTEGANKEIEQRTEVVKERPLSSACISCSGNNAIVVSASLEELTDS